MFGFTFSQQTICIKYIENGHETGPVADANRYQPKHVLTPEILHHLVKRREWNLKNNSKNRRK
jgi:hypothetical protein